MEIQDIYKVAREPSIVHCSSIVESKDGVLHSVWYQGAWETSGDTVIRIAHKSPGESSWGEAQTLFDFNGIPLGNPVLWAVDGRLYITFSVLLEESWKSGLLFYSVSDDDGTSWTEPSLFSPGKGFVAKNQPIQNQFGEILFPLYHEAEYCPYIMIIKDRDRILFSPMVAETMARNKAIQPALCTGASQKLIMLCRTNQGKIWQSISRNDGYSWSICGPLDLPNPDSALDLLNLKDGRILLVSNPAEKNRRELRLSISSDSGDSWSDFKTLVTGSGEYSYPCMILDSRGAVHITFTEDRFRIRHIELKAEELND